MPFALPDALFFTGIGGAAETHAVCVMDAGGKIVAEFTIGHSAAGIATLARRRAGLLLEAGHPGVPVKPDAIKTWRDGEVLAGARPDAGEAAVIAGYLRLRARKLKAVAPDSATTLAGISRPARHAAALARQASGQIAA